jgi:hypothetical protein
MSDEELLEQAEIRLAAATTARLEAEANLQATQQALQEWQQAQLAKAEEMLESGKL